MNVRRYAFVLVCLCMAMGLAKAQDDLHPANYQLVWSDEFNEGSQLSTSKWEWENQNSGWVNHEEENYRPGTQTIDGRHTTEITDGHLNINCFMGSDGKIYSGRINAKNGGAGWTYGYFVARIKLPKGSGTWPAFWMMPIYVDWANVGWPRCGEIDIMEEVGNRPNYVSSSYHAEGHYWKVAQQVTHEMYQDGAEDDYHIYALKWTPTNMTTYVDGKVQLSYDNPGTGDVDWPYHVPFHLILNVAYGGDWGAAAGVNYNALPVQMQVDYVRVYQEGNYEAMKADGSGAAYIIGAYNSVGQTNYVAGENYTWDGNVVPMTTNGKIHTWEGTVGKNLNGSYVNFKFFPNPATYETEGFTSSAGTYHVTLQDNDWFYLGDGNNGRDNGNIGKKEGVTLQEGDTYVFTLDCTNGPANAVLKVAKKEIPLNGIWIIGADGSVGQTQYGSGFGWTESNAIAMTKLADGVYTFDMTIGQQLNASQVNFKFFPQAGWGNEFLGTINDYSLTTTSTVFGVGTGSDGHDNGNVYLRTGQTLTAGDTYTFKVDATAGANHAVLTVTKKGDNNNNGGNGSSTGKTDKVVIAYVTSWSSITPDPTKMTHINYAFGGIGSDGRSVFADNTSRLRNVVALKNQNPNLKVLLSVGGWGRGGFSEMCANESNRLAFAQSCAAFCDQYNLDGIDIDWEYPTSSSAGISSSSADRENFTLLMRDLRNALGNNRLVTLATVCNANSQFYNFRDFIQYVDFVNIMSYDMASPPSHHSALYRGGTVGNGWCVADEAVKAHLNNGVPANKLVMGLAFYGNGNGDGSGSGNQVSLQEIENGIASGKWIDHWDDTAKVPYVTNTSGQFVFGYDNERSLTIKCQYIIDNGLLGGMYWEYNNDDNAGTERTTVANMLLTPIEAPALDGLWIIGANGSVGVPAYTSGGNWEPENAIAMYKNGDRFTFTFKVGETLNPDDVNFKFFGQAGWGTEYQGTSTSLYHISSSSSLFGVGEGRDVNGYDNGNIFLKAGQTLNVGDEVTITIDCSEGYGDAKLYSMVTPAVVDGISNVETRQAAPATYTLQGVRVDKPGKGVYIREGRKVVIR